MKKTVLVAVILSGSIGFGLGSVTAPRRVSADPNHTVYVEEVPKNARKNPMTIRGSHVVGFACTRAFENQSVCFVATTD